MKTPIPLIFSESFLGYKFSKIFCDIPIDFRRVKYHQFIIFILKNLLIPLEGKRNIFFHIRYIKWHGFFKTIPIHLTIIILCKIKNIKIIWTCHNIWEYSFNSKIQNIFLRHYIYKFSDIVVVLHNDIREFLPKHSRNKIRVACYGDFKDYVEEQSSNNYDFRRKYQQWKDLHNINKPDIVFISTLPNVKKLTEMACSISEYSFLFIAPKSRYSIESENIFLYNGFVWAEVKDILKEEKIIGLIALDNISVPTSLYLFASYGIPIIALDQLPMKKIINQYKIGKTFTYELHNFIKMINIIKTDYKYYSNNVKSFLKYNTWQKASKVYSNIFKS